MQVFQHQQQSARARQRLQTFAQVSQATVAYLLGLGRGIFQVGTGAQVEAEHFTDKSRLHAQIIGQLSLLWRKSLPYPGFQLVAQRFRRVAIQYLAAVREHIVQQGIGLVLRMRPGPAFEIPEGGRVEV